MFSELTWINVLVINITIWTAVIYYRNETKKESEKRNSDRLKRLKKTLC